MHRRVFQPSAGSLCAMPMIVKSLHHAAVHMEANAHQHVPAANEPSKKRFSGILNITNGRMATETLTGLRLSAV